MELEVILQGKGSITIKDELNRTDKAIRRMSEHAVGLINAAAEKRPAFGFEGGTGVQVENAANWHVPAVADVDARA